MLAPIVLGLGVAGLVWALGPLWTAWLTPATTPLIVAVTGLAVWAYAGHTTVLGSAAGDRNWDVFAGLGIADASVRLFAILAVSLVASSLTSYQLAAAIPAATWALAIGLRPVRRALTNRTDVPGRRLLRNSGFAMVSSASNAVLTVGYPTFIRLVADDLDAAATAGLILAVSLTRTPIIAPFQAFQTVAIAAFLRQRSRLSALVKPLLGLCVFGIVVATLFAWVGPRLIQWVYGASYIVPPLLLASLTLVAVAIAALTLTGTAAIAVGAHRVYSAGWLVAAGLSVALLWAPGGAYLNVAVALLLGPLTGTAIHVWGIRRADRGETSA
jgi:O-antigen/teichoic acid export membrane protein